MKKHIIFDFGAVLIDDSIDNITAAKKLGIHGICFSNPVLLAEELKLFNIELKLKQPRNK